MDDMTAHYDKLIFKVLKDTVEKLQNSGLTKEEAQKLVLDQFNKDMEINFYGRSPF